ncbi:MAG: protein kinase domain-containing protein [Polyangiaceae bacterium]|jgi:eukaryotic-like serine/threonine-protein kinase
MADRAQPAMSKSTGAPDPLIGRLINDRFKITALIARGGMGKVYRAEQAPLGRVCAIKVLNPNYAGEHDPEFHKRFFLEASIASKLTHPNTVTIFDYGRTDDDIYYMAMEYLEGHTLHRAIREAGSFPEERGAHIARQICRALREAHSLGVIHRDLKPANIFLVEHGDETDFVKVLDFGLVKDVSEGKPAEELTQTGLFMGSPKYMAPEQIRGDKVDARTDIYSLGIIMYEMCTGKVPFDRPNSVNILMAHVNEEAPPLRVMNPNINPSPAFEETILRCMAKDPDTRFRSMDEVLAALKRVGGAAMTATVSGVGATGEYRSMGISGGYGDTGSGGSGKTSSGPHSAISGSGAIPAPLVDPSGSGDLQKKGSKGVLIGAVLGVVVLAGIFMVARGGKPAAAPAAPIAQVVAPTSKPPVAVPTPAPAAVATIDKANMFVKMRINTDPDGASVKEDGYEVCNSTPCEITYKGPVDCDPAKDHKLLISKTGYKVENKTVKIGDSPVSVKLTRAPVYYAPQPAPQPKPAEKKDNDDSVKGFKELPY